MDKKVSISAPWFATADELLRKLEARPEGLTEVEVATRVAEYGSNDFQRRERASVTRLLAKQFASPLIFILVGAAVLTGVLGEWVNMGVIIGAVVVNVGLGFYREYHAEHTLDQLATYIKDRSRVMREGIEQEIDSMMLVPGDIIKLSYGSRVPADARLISVNNLRIDEAILTGESLPIEKKVDQIAEAVLVADRINMVHAGTLVVEGFATALVVHTGIHTEIGKIAGIVSSIDRAPTPIQTGIKKLSWFIFCITILIVVAIFVLGLLKGEPIFNMLVLSLAVAVGAVPEALPIALTVILAVGAERIAARKGVVRKLAAAETLGSTTMIMTDKTGTLTKADMQLVGVYPVSVLLLPSHTSGHLAHLSPEQKSILTLALSNIDVVVENPQSPESEWKFIGRPFEVNIAKACLLHHISIDSMLSKKSLLHIPFNSTNKFSVSSHDRMYIVMGAPDVLLKRAAIGKDEYLRIESWIHETSSRGERLIALGTLRHEEVSRMHPDAITNIEFKGILSFHDPIREEVPEAIRTIEARGVRVVIMTGDLRGTALAVATALGWHVTDTEIITGNDIHTMNDEELKEIIPRIKIFARVTPEDKLRVGMLYRDLGEVVAMTGDGVNDAPALKAMDIGVSLGSGSDVAKSAADLVLLDDNFQTITMAIDEGRRILANVRKTFMYLMSNSLDEVIVVGGSLVAGIALPVTALQIIWVNLFTGSLPALAFAFDQDLDKEKNHHSFAKDLFTKEVKVISLGIGVMTSVLLFFLYWWLISIGLAVPVARSIFFVCFSSYILVVAFSFRSLHRPLFSYNVFSNKKLNLSVLIAFLILIATITIPFMREVFGIAPLPLSWLWVVGVWLVLNVALVELAKLWFQYSSSRNKHIKISS
ncbi:HAD-IC family P-type ATPase [Candidatus Nomurabacteria bacterium]|nr:MAG: HAD-IC family P-type ATPase [Candidatus Nomurabacteria bacterium]